MPETPATPLPPEPLPGFCLRCGKRLDLHPLADEGVSKCPRCGLTFDPNRPETYAHRSKSLALRYGLPGLILALLTGITSYAVIRGDENMGYALFFGVPFAVGGLLGYYVRATVWLTGLASLFVISCMVFVLVAMDLSGIFCGAILGAMFLGPMLVGAVIGWAFRIALRGSAWGARGYAFSAVFLLLPFGLDRIERRWPMGLEVAEVSTSATLPVDAGRAWDSVLFYEQVEHDPPFLLTLALPRPVRTEGSKAAPGDVQRCVYHEGHILKRITRVEPPRALAFDVTEQHLHFEHDVELIDGAFVLDPLDARTTRVILTTRYRRLLRPAWVWEPMERAVLHSLHGHVLEGMRRRAAAADEPVRAG